MKRSFNYCHFIDQAVLSYLSIFIIVFLCSILVPATSHAYDYSSYNNSSNPMLNQPTARWYRYYINGQPNLSTTVTEQHIRYGYEVLDRNMQVIRRVSPYIPESYERQKARQEALAAQHEADMNLRRAYGSAAQATVKRDQILADMQSRKTYLQAQLVDLQNTLTKNIALAAVYERQRKTIPNYLQKNMDENRRNVTNAEQNIKAIAERQEQTRLQYEQIIQRLNRL